MATNADNTKVADDDKEVTEGDLRALKYPSTEVETPANTEEDEPAEDDDTPEAPEDAGDNDEDKPADDTEDEDSEDGDETPADDEPSEFVKQVPSIKGDTVVDYARNLEVAYQQSTAEALRQKKRADDAEAAKNNPDAPSDVPAAGTPGESKPKGDMSLLELWANQELQKTITKTWETFSKGYSQQANDPVEYEKFRKRVATISKSILEDEQRLAEPEELYSAAAASLGWKSQSATPTAKESLGMAIKDNAATAKITPSTTKKIAKSKVTDAMVAASKLMYPDKSDDEIRKELEPYV